ncbi:hypothetical protein K438DRAFT_1789867 [Mycena galopus ATCC 62051]|nr:hypothetical protein K438DRAFT_1789867 [Mycena galopus ATCC 62051]
MASSEIKSSACSHAEPFSASLASWGGAYFAFLLPATTHTIVLPQDCASIRAIELLEREKTTNVPYSWAEVRIVGCGLIECSKKNWAPPGGAATSRRRRADRKRAVI